MSVFLLVLMATIQMSLQSKFPTNPKDYRLNAIAVQISTVQKTYSQNSIAVWTATVQMRRVQMILIKYYEMCRSSQSDMWLQMLYGSLSGKKLRFLCTCNTIGCCLDFVSFVEVVLGKRNSSFFGLRPWYSSSIRL